MNNSTPHPDPLIIDVDLSSGTLYAFLQYVYDPVELYGDYRTTILSEAEVGVGGLVKLYVFGQKYDCDRLLSLIRSSVDGMYECELEDRQLFDAASAHDDVILFQNSIRGMNYHSFIDEQRTIWEFAKAVKMEWRGPLLQAFIKTGRITSSGHWVSRLASDHDTNASETERKAWRSVADNFDPKQWRTT